MKVTTNHLKRKFERYNAVRFGMTFIIKKVEDYYIVRWFSNGVWWPWIDDEKLTLTQVAKIAREEGVDRDELVAYNL